VLRACGHHEWWDGSGYPSGVVGEEIPLRARIADVFDAISHARRYKPAWPVEQALDEIQGLSGRQFDPRVVSAFREVNAHQLARGPRRKHLTAVA